LHTHVHCNIIHNSQGVEMTQVSTGKLIDGLYIADSINPGMKVFRIFFNLYWTCTEFLVITLLTALRKGSLSYGIIWMNLEDMKQTSYKRTNTIWLHSLKVAKVVKITETESRKVIVKSWAERVSIWEAQSFTEDEKVLEMCSLGVSMYLTQLNCTLTHEMVNMLLFFFTTAEDINAL
jgi:hypothetical protein